MPDSLSAPPLESVQQERTCKHQQATIDEWTVAFALKIESLPLRTKKKSHQLILFCRTHFYFSSVRIMTAIKSNILRAPHYGLMRSKKMSYASGAIACNSRKYSGQRANILPGTHCQVPLMACAVKCENVVWA